MVEGGIAQGKRQAIKEGIKEGMALFIFPLLESMSPEFISSEFNIPLETILDVIDKK